MLCREAQFDLLSGQTEGVGHPGKTRRCTVDQLVRSHAAKRDCGNAPFQDITAFKPH